MQLDGVTDSSTDQSGRVMSLNDYQEEGDEARTESCTSPRMRPMFLFLDSASIYLSASILSCRLAAHRVVFGSHSWCLCRALPCS